MSGSTYLWATCKFASLAALLATALTLTGCGGKRANKGGAPPPQPTAQTPANKEVPVASATSGDMTLSVTRLGTRGTGASGWLEASLTLEEKGEPTWDIGLAEATANGTPASAKGSTWMLTTRMPKLVATTTWLHFDWRGMGADTKSVRLAVVLKAPGKTLAEFKFDELPVGPCPPPVVEASRSGKSGTPATQAPGGSGEPGPEAAATGLETIKLEPPKVHGGFIGFAFSPDGRTLAGGTGHTAKGTPTEATGGKVVLWDAATGKLKQTLGSHSDNIDWVAFSQNGQAVASVSVGTGVVKVWDVRTGRLRGTVTTKEMLAGYGFEHFLALSADGSVVATVAVGMVRFGKATTQEAQTLSAWDTRTGKRLWSRTEPTLKAMALSPDGNTLACFVAKTKWHAPRPDGSAYGDVLSKSVKLWDFRTGKVKQTIDPGKHYPSLMDYLPDGKTLATVEGNKLELWDLRTRRVRKEVSLDRRPDPSSALKLLL